MLQRAFNHIATQILQSQPIRQVRSGLRSLARAGRWEAGVSGNSSLFSFFDRSVGSLTTKQDGIDERNAHIRDYAERLVWFTQGYTDPAELRAEIDCHVLSDHYDVTAREVVDYLEKHLDELPLHNAGERRGQMLQNTRAMLDQNLFNKALQSAPQAQADQEIPRPEL